MMGYKVDQLVVIAFERIDTWNGTQLLNAGFNPDMPYRVKSTDKSGNVLLNSPKYCVDLWVEKAHVMPYVSPKKAKEKPKTAIQVMEEGLKAMKERAKLRDSAEGERSMKAAVEAFNALTGTGMTEEEGWLFMAVLKAARSRKGHFHIDDYVDGAAYFALAGEAAATEAKNEGY
ncbi:DUF6378 domain-containing protein [Chromobacterium amazonense]|nr:DUF6378 domain-containing protein [Chromobacterium amazonense]